LEGLAGAALGAGACAWIKVADSARTANKGLMRFIVLTL